MPAVLPAPPVPTHHVFYHRGFSLQIRHAGPGYGFAIAQGTHPLHASRPEYATALSADRAARQFVDDAIGAFEYATQAMEA